MNPEPGFQSIYARKLHASDTACALCPDEGRCCETGDCKNGAVFSQLPLHISLRVPEGAVCVKTACVRGVTRPATSVPKGHNMQGLKLYKPTI